MSFTITPLTDISANIIFPEFLIGIQGAETYFDVTINGNQIKKADWPPFQDKFINCLRTPKGANNICYYVLKKFIVENEEYYTGIILTYTNMVFYLNTLVKRINKMYGNDGKLDIYYKDFNCLMPEEAINDIKYYFIQHVQRFQDTDHNTFCNEAMKLVKNYISLKYPASVKIWKSIAKPKYKELSLKINNQKNKIRDIYEIISDFDSKQNFQELLSNILELSPDEFKSFAYGRFNYPIEIGTPSSALPLVEKEPLLLKDDDGNNINIELLIYPESYQDLSINFHRVDEEEWKLFQEELINDLNGTRNGLSNICFHKIRKYVVNTQICFIGVILTINRIIQFEIIVREANNLYYNKGKAAFYHTCFNVQIPTVAFDDIRLFCMDTIQDTKDMDYDSYVQETRGLATHYSLIKHQSASKIWSKLEFYNEKVEYVTKKLDRITQNMKYAQKVINHEIMDNEEYDNFISNFAYRRLPNSPANKNFIYALIKDIKMQAANK